MKRSSPVHRPVERKVNWSIWKIVLQSQQCSAFFKQLEKDTFVSTTILIKVEAEGDVLKKISKILGKYLYRSICFDKVKGWRPLILLIRDPDTGVFIWILWNFQCHYFCRSDCVIVFVKVNQKVKYLSSRYHMKSKIVFDLSIF